MGEHKLKDVVEADNIKLVIHREELKYKHLEFQIELDDAIITVPATIGEVEHLVKKNIKPTVSKFKEGFKNFEINDYLSLKLENEEAMIYVDGHKFRQCKYLQLNIPTHDIAEYDQINSIDEAEYLSNRLEHNTATKMKEIKLSPEENFWGHCSNLQAWADNNYDTRLLHRNLAFSLLRQLKKAGDPVAKRVFKEEIAKRLSDPRVTKNVLITLKDYIHVLNIDQVRLVLEVMKDEKLKAYFINSAYKESSHSHTWKPLYMQHFDIIYKHLAKHTYQTNLKTFSYDELTEYVTEYIKNEDARQVVLKFIFENRNFPEDRKKYRDDLVEHYQKRLINAKPDQARKILKSIYLKKEEIFPLIDKLVYPITRLFILSRIQGSIEHKLLRNGFISTVPDNIRCIPHLSVIYDADEASLTLETNINDIDEALSHYREPRSIYDDIKCKLRMNNKLIDFNIEFHNTLVVFPMKGINTAKELMHRDEDIEIMIPKTNFPLVLSSENQELRIYIEPKIIYP